MRDTDWWRDITWGRLTTRGDSRGCPPWVHFSCLTQGNSREDVIGGHKRINKGRSRRDVSWPARHCRDGLPWVSGPQKQTVWPRVASGNPDQDYVLGGVFLHHGQAQEGGARDQRVAPMHPDKFPQNPGRVSNVEPSDRAIACPQDQWVSPLPSYAGSPVIRE